MSVDKWILVLTAAVLIVGVVAAVGGVLAAKYARPAWKAWRAKPDLQLSVRKGPGDWFDLRLTNSGEGTARDWIVTLKLPVMPDGGGRLASADEVYRHGKYVRGWSEGRTAEGWTGTWTSAGASDVIGPGLYRDHTLRPASAPVSEVEYVIQASAMDHRLGRLTIPEP